MRFETWGPGACAGCTLLITLAQGLAVAQQPSPTEYRSFSSSSGGYSLEIPAEWHVTEVVARDLYRGFLTREKVEGEEDPYEYGIAIYRFFDRENFLGRAHVCPLDILPGYAERLVPLEMPEETQGMKLSRFHLLPSEDECAPLDFLEGSAGKQYFHAAWTSPCQEAEAARAKAEVEHMIASLQVFEEWQTEGQ